MPDPRKSVRFLAPRPQADLACFTPFCDDFNLCLTGRWF
jgi:hypothetical protein